MLKRKASNIDELIGRRIENRRKTLGLSVSSFSKRLGVSSQQLYKYETGVNRISASALKEISEILNVSLDHFFDGSFGSSVKEVEVSFSEDSTIPNNDLNALRAYFLSIKDVQARATIIRVARVMALLSSEEKRRASEKRLIRDLAIHQTPA